MFEATAIGEPAPEIDATLDDDDDDDDDEDDIRSGATESGDAADRMEEEEIEEVLTGVLAVGVGGEALVGAATAATASSVATKEAAVATGAGASESVTAPALFCVVDADAAPAARTGMRVSESREWKPPVSFKWAVLTSEWARGTEDTWEFEEEMEEEVEEGDGEP